MITHQLRLMALAATVTGAALALHPAAAKADEAACASLKAAGLFAQTTVTSATMVAADAAKNTPAYCEVKGEISPNAKSHIGVVFRLPENWNGRILGYLGKEGYGANEYGEAHYMTMSPDLKTIFVGDTVNNDIKKYVLTQ